MRAVSLDIEDPSSEKGVKETEVVADPFETRVFSTEDHESEDAGSGNAERKKREDRWNEDHIERVPRIRGSL